VRGTRRGYKERVQQDRFEQAVVGAALDPFGYSASFAVDLVALVQHPGDPITFEAVDFSSRSLCPLEGV